jgi:arylsulfatase
VELGVVRPGTVLPLRNPGVRAWTDLDDDQRRLYARQMEVYAGVVTHTDAQIGRLLDFLDEAGLTDDTVIMVLSDNGASAEGGPDGRSNALGWFNGVPESVAEMLEQADAWGSPDTHPHYASGWAMAGNTPNRMYKAFVHEGGTRDPLIVSWPGHVPDPGAVRSQFHHVVDVVPTLMELIGLPWPDSVRGHHQRPLEGTSFASTLTDGDAPTRKTRQYFEMFAHRAIWADGWKAVAMHWSRAVLARLGPIEAELHDGDHDADRWELYHLDEDMSEMNDLAASHPDKLAELVDLWWEEAGRHRVLPLDDTLLERLLAPRPYVFEERDVYTYAARVRLPRQGSPTVRDRSYWITAEVDLDEPGAGRVGEGVVVSYGGSTGGFSLCVLDGRVHYVSNFLGRTHTVASSRPVGPGPHLLEVRFARTEPNAGRVTLLVDGEAHDEVDVPRTNPVVFSSTEGLEVGTDSVSPVWPRYRSPFPFTGAIRRVVIATRPPEGPPPPEVVEAEARLAMHRQ